jgi:hypothetical protein
MGFELGQVRRSNHLEVCSVCGVKITPRTADALGEIGVRRIPLPFLLQCLGG